MKFFDLLMMSVNNLRRRKLRTALTVLGVIIGTASIVVMVSLGIGLNELNRELIESYGSLTAVTVHGQNYYGGSDGKTEPKYLNDEMAKVFSRIPHVTSVAPMLEYQVLMKQGVYEANVSLMGTTQEYMSQIPLGEGTLPDKNSKNLEMIVGNRIAQWFSNSKTGKGYWDTGEIPAIDFMGKPMFVIFDMDSYYSSQGGDAQAKAPKKYMLNTAGMVAGSFDDYSDYAFNVYVDIDLLRAQLKKIYGKKAIPGQPTNQKGKPLKELVYSQMIVNVDKMENVMDVQNALTEDGFQAYSNMEWMEQSEKQSGMIQTVLGGIGAVSLFVAAIGIANTMMMSIYERTKEIGVIKVLGCDMGVIRDMFLIESGFIGFFGGIIGIVLSYGVSFLMNRFMGIAQVMTGMAGDISRIPAWLSGAAVVFAIFVGMAAGFFPALRAMRLSPLAAIRND